MALLISAGIPGRVRIQAIANDVQANLELMQIPSTADTIDLSIYPACVLNDGRDMVAISMDVEDEYGQTVTNGTLLTVRWDEGLGFARTIDGTATLRLPAFSRVGEYVFNAGVGDVTSSDVILRVVEESCLE